MRKKIYFREVRRARRTDQRKRGERHELHGNKSRGVGGRKFVVYIKFIIEFYTR